MLHAYLLYPELSTARIWVASKDMGMQSVQQFEGFYTVLLYVTSYTIKCACTELLNDIDSAQLLYHGAL